MCNYRDNRSFDKEVVQSGSIIERDASSAVGTEETTTRPPSAAVSRK